MAKRRIRLTGFTKFIFIMIFVAPIAYIGASYYNGEDGIENLKKMLKIGEKTEQVQDQPANDNTTIPVNQPNQGNTTTQPATNNSGQVKALESEIKKLKLHIKNLESRIEALEK